MQYLEHEYKLGLFTLTVYPAIAVRRHSVLVLALRTKREPDNLPSNPGQPLEGDQVIEVSAPFSIST